MYQRVKYDFRQELANIRESGLYKEERVISSDQKPGITVRYPEGAEARDVLNFCANNYLGLANHPRVVAAAHEALDRYGFGMASVRFICGTQEPHRALEGRISEFYETDDTILYSSCFDANGGLFESILGPEDAIVTDALNHASIIDGIRLCKAKRYIYDHSDMAALERGLKRVREGMDPMLGDGLSGRPDPLRTIGLMQLLRFVRHPVRWIRDRFSQPIHLLYPGADLERFSPSADGKTVREELGFQDKTVLLYAGSVGPMHEFGMLLDAFAAVQAFPPDGDSVPPAPVTDLAASPGPGFDEGAFAVTPDAGAAGVDAGTPITDFSPDTGMTGQAPTPEPRKAKRGGGVGGKLVALVLILIALTIIMLVIFLIMESREKPAWLSSSPSLGYRTSEKTLSR